MNSTALGNQLIGTSRQQEAALEEWEILSAYR